jgi:hypothetical protein
MDDYPYTTLGADRWLRYDKFRDVLHRFDHTGLPCTVAARTVSLGVDTARSTWISRSTDDDLDDTLERAAHQALTEFCERHVPSLAGAAIALFPVQNKGNTAWSERLAAVSTPERTVYHVGWVFKHLVIMLVIRISVLPKNRCACMYKISFCLF